MALPQVSNLLTGVRFPLPAQKFNDYPIAKSKRASS